MPGLATGLAAYMLTHRVAKLQVGKLLSSQALLLRGNEDGLALPIVHVCFLCMAVFLFGFVLGISGPEL